MSWVWIDRRALELLHGESLREHEAKLIREALRSAHGNQRRAAALLELPLRTFERKLRNMNLRQQAIARVTM